MAVRATPREASQAFRRLPGMETLQRGFFRTRLITYTPVTQPTTIAIDPGLTTPRIEVDGFSRAPSRTPDTRITTSSPSRTGVSAPIRNVNGRLGPATT